MATINLDLNAFFSAIKHEITKMGGRESEIDTLVAEQTVSLPEPNVSPADTSAVIDTSDFIITGTSGNDMVGPALPDGHVHIVSAKEGDDHINGGTGTDFIDGGTGIDTVDYSYDTDGVYVDLAAQFAVAGGKDVDLISNVENIIGTTANDVLVGNDVGNVFRTNGGNDIIIGNGGNDVVQLTGQAEDYTFTSVSNGGIKIEGTDGTTTLVYGVELVQFQNGSEGGGVSFFSLEAGGGSGIAHDDTAAVSENGSVDVDLLANDELFGNDPDSLFAGIDDGIDDGMDATVASLTGVYGTLTLAVADGDEGNVTYTTNDDSLNEGEVVTDTFTYILNNGETADLVITITGTNDAPTIAASMVSGTEDDLQLTVDLTALGDDADDEDDGDSLTYAVTTGPASGSATISMDGDFLVFEPGSDFDYLAVGEMATVTVGITATDSRGQDSAEQTITVTITGANDGPSFSVTGGGDTSALLETNAGLTTSGSVDVSDVDVSDVVNVTASFDAAVPSGAPLPAALDAAFWNSAFSLTGATPAIDGMSTTGSVGWGFDSGSEAFDFLNKDETLTVTYTLTADDGTTTATQTVAITITGTNDTPTISDDSGAAEEDGASITFDLASLSDDADEENDGSNLAYAISTSPSEGSASISGTTLTFDPGGDFQDLAAGETRDVTIQVTATDNQMASATNTITVTVTGTDDDPTITMVGSDSAAESLTEGDSPLSTSGTLTIGDVDTSNEVTVSASLTSQTGTGDGASLPSGLSTMLDGFFSVPSGTVVDSMSQSASMTWNFNSGSETFDFLEEGDTIVLTYTVVASDGAGPVATKDVVITITGTNDAPTILEGPGLPEEVNEFSQANDNAMPETAVLSTGGQFLVEDLDNANELTVSVLPTPVISLTPASGVSPMDPGELEAMFSGSVSSVLFSAHTSNTNARQVNYNFGAQDQFVDFLGVGDTLSLTYTVRVSDGLAHVDQEVVIQIHGANDAPVISVGMGDSDSASLTETDAGLMASDTLTVTDLDLSDTVDVVSALSSSNWSGGTLDPGVSAALDGYFSATPAVSAVPVDVNTGTISWTFDSGSEAFDFLSEGETLELVYTVTATDTEGVSDTHDVTITITGTNDAPVIDAGGNTGAVTETGDVAGVIEAGEDGGLEIDPALLTPTVQAALDDNLDFVDAMDGVATSVNSVFSTIETALGGNTQQAMLVMWDFLDDQYTSVAPAQLPDLNEAFARLNLIYAQYVEDGGEPLHDVIVKYTPDGGDGGSNPDRVQAMHDNMLGNLIESVLDGRFTDPVLTELKNAVAAINPEILTRDYFSGNEGTSSALVDQWDIDNDNTPTASGTLTAQDADHDAVLTWSGNATGTYGTFTIDPTTGEWLYVLDLDDPDTQALAEGQMVVDTFTVTVTDDEMGTDTVTVTINVTGSNDAAVITGAITGTATEDAGGTPSATGTLAAADVDNPDDSFTVESGAATYGSWSMDAGGTWEYTVDDGNPAVDALNVGDTLTDSFVVHSIDGTPKVISITIEGANDDAIISGDLAGDVTEAPGAPGTAMGTATASDVDNADNVFQSNSGISTYGTWSVDGSGNWSYTVNDANPAVDALDPGDTLSDSFVIESEDGTEQTISITINGADDAAVVTGDTTGSVTEGNIGDPAVVATGAIGVSDVDGDDNPSFSGASAMGAYGSIAVNAVGDTWTYTLDQSTVQDLHEGESVTDTLVLTDSEGNTQTVEIAITGTNDDPTLSVGSGSAGEDGPAVTIDLAALGDDIDNDDDGASLTYTIVGPPSGGLASISGTDLTFDPDGDFESLPAGMTTTVTVTVRATDMHGAYAENDVTITITGANDVPTITASMMEDTSVKEDGGVANGTTHDPSAGGQLTISDPDSGEGSFQVPAAVDLAGTYGDFVFNEATGAWSYTLDQAKADSLADGAMASDSLTVTSFDGSETHTITVNIEGTNDAAVIVDVATPDTSVTEASGVANGTPGDATASGQVTSTDVDGTDNLFQGVTGASATYGTYDVDTAGNWTYTLDDGNGAVQALNVGGTLTDTVTVTAEDGTTHDITITINGANDAAVIAGVDTGAVDEDGADAPVSTGGTLTISDVDSPADFVADSGSSAYGTYSVTSAGVWTYTLDDTNPTVDALGEGDPLADSFTVTSADGTTHTVNISITGTEDAPVVADVTVGDGMAADADASSDTSGNVYEDGGASGLLPESVAGDALRVAGDSDDAPGGADVTVASSTNASDAEPGDEATLVVTNVANAAKATSGAVPGSGTTTLMGVYGSLAIGANGGYVYTLYDTSTMDGAALNALAHDQVATETFTFTVADGDGTSTDAALNFTVVGTNDDPVIGDIMASVQEDVGETMADELVASGSTFISDPDAGDTHSVASISGTTEGSLTANVNGSGELEWEYTVDNGSTAVQSLGVGESFTDTFFVEVQDSQGGSTTVQVDVEVMGTNDIPTIATTSGSFVAEESEVPDGISVNVLDLLGADDVDVNDVLTINDLDGTATLTLQTPFGPFSLSLDLDGLIGSDLMVLDEFGNLSIPSEFTDVLTSFMNTGDTLEIDASISVKDNHGAVSDTGTFDLTLNGADPAGAPSEPAYGLGGGDMPNFLMPTFDDDGGVATA